MESFPEQSQAPQTPQLNQQLKVELDDLYKIIGESNVIRHYLQKEIEKLNRQIFEMSEEIMRLRDGELRQSENNDPIRRFPGGVQGEGRGHSDHVQGRSDESSGRVDKVI